MPRSNGPSRSLPSERGKTEKSELKPEVKLEAKLQKEPRRSARARKEVQNLQIDPKKKSYEHVASATLHSALKMPSTIPNEVSGPKQVVT